MAGPESPCVVVAPHLGPYRVAFFHDRPLQPGLRCHRAGCSCRAQSFIWVSHKLKALYFEASRSASTSIKVALGFGAIPPQAYAYAAARALVEQGEGGEVPIRILSPSLTPYAEYLQGEIERQMARIQAGEQEIPPPQGPHGFAMVVASPGEARRRWPDYYAFSTFRDPHKRLVSCYHAVRQPDSRAEFEDLFGLGAAGLSFKDFVLAAEEVRDHHWEEAAAFYPLDADGRVLLDGVCRVSNMAEDWARVTAALGLEAPLGHVNRAPRAPGAPPAFDADMEAVMARMFPRDLALADVYSSDDR